MRIISKQKLRAFWAEHPEAEGPLLSWHRMTSDADWSKPLDVRDTFRGADPIGDEFVVFNVCKNRYRLIIRVDYSRSIVYVWDVVTHAAYSVIDLRKLDEHIKGERRRE